MIVEEQNIDVEGLPVHYLTAGEGPTLVLLHALGESALDWRWVLPALARTHRIYAPDLPGFGYSAKPSAEYSPAFFARFVGAYLDALGLEHAAVVWGKTPLGAFQRAWLRVPLLFACPGRVPAEWITEQTRIAQLPGFTEATMTALRTQVDLGGQREVLVGQLPQLQMPTLVVWGERDRVFPYSQGQKALSRLRQGSLELVPDCGHLPHVERPDRFAAILGQFLEGQVHQ